MGVACMAGEESGAPQDRRSPAEPYQVTEVMPLHADAELLPLSDVEQEAVDFIQANTISMEMDLVQKLQFLNSICILCSMAGQTSLTLSHDIFCLLKNQCKKIEVLLREEPMEQLSTGLRYCCMNTIAALSTVNAVTEEEILHLFKVCCSIVFYLPPARALNISLYNQTLEAMDDMLQIVLDVCPIASVKSRLQGILEVLLPFSISKTQAVCERALGRIWKLSGFMTSSFWQQPLGKNLAPSQRTDIALVTLEKIIGDYGFDEKKWAETMLDVLRRNPGTWLMDVPEILGFIHANLKIQSTSVQQILLSVLDMLTVQFPRDVLRSVLTDLPQNDSTTLDILKSVLTLLEASKRIWDELSSVLQDQQLCEILSISTEELGLLRLTAMPPTEELVKELCKPALLQKLLNVESLPVLWLVLRRLVLLSDRPETAIEIRALLPGVMENLLFANTAITVKVLNIFRNAMHHLGKRHASPFALELAEKILPLFNHASSEVREGSIRLFMDVMDAVLWSQKGSMKKIVRRALHPLLFHMSDETLSVAQASGEALVSCAKFLKWKELKQQTQQKNTVGIMKCLLQQDRKGVEGYLQQSLPYLEDSQASLRCEAVRFIGLIGKHAREQSEEMLNELCSALQPLEDDPHLTVCSMASETIQKLRHQRQKAAPAWRRLPALFRWSCIAF